MRKLILTIILIVMIFPSFTTLMGESHLLNIENTIEIALKNNLEILQERKKLDQAEKGVKIAVSGFLPTLSMSGSRILKEKLMIIEMPSFIPGEPDMEIELDFTKNYEISFQLVQPIFYGGKLWLNLKLKNQLKKAQKLLLRAKENEIKAKTKASFFTIILMKESLNVVEQGLKYIKDTKEKISNMFKEGLVKKLDLMRAEDLVREYESKQKEINKKLFVSINNLKLILNFSEKDSLEIDGVIKECNMDLEESNLTNKLILNNPIINSLNKKYEMSKLNLKFAYSELLPTVGLGLQYNYRGDSLKNISEWDNSYTFALSFSIPIFNSGSRILKIGLAKSQKEETNFKIIDYKKKLKNELINTLKHDDFLKEKIEYTKNKKLSAEEELKLSKLSYSEGLISYTDLELVQTQLFNSKMGYLQSIFEYYVNIFKLETLIGEDVLFTK